MSNESDNNYFWPAYVDFMIVLFFIALAAAGFYITENKSTQTMNEAIEIVNDSLVIVNDSLVGLIEVSKKYETLVKEIINLNDELKLEFKKNNIEVNKSAEDRISLNSQIFFDPNKSNLKNQTAIDQIYSIGKSIKYILDQSQDSKMFSVIIEGHTDSDAGEDYNFLLSYNRALTIANIWNEQISLGLPNYEIIPAGFGELRPIKDNSNESNKSFNRRIEIRIVPNMRSFYKTLNQ